MKKVQQNEINIAINATKIESIQGDIKYIKSQVSNHIPTSIKKLKENIELKIDVLDKEQVKRNKEQDDKINQAFIRIAGITSTVIVVSQIVFFLLR